METALQEGTTTATKCQQHNRILQENNKTVVARAGTHKSWQQLDIPTSPGFQVLSLANLMLSHANQMLGGRDNPVHTVLRSL